MPTVKESVQKIAVALNALHEASAPSGEGGRELDALHAELWDGLCQHKVLLGLTDTDLDDISEIGSSYAAGRNGQAKPRTV